MVSIADTTQIASLNLRSIVQFTSSTQLAISTQEQEAMLAKTIFRYAHQPNCRFNADAKTGHALGILLARFGALRASRSGAG
jgi:hypothetical protein